MSLHEVARIRVRVDSELSEEFEVKGTVLLPFFVQWPLMLSLNLPERVC